MKKITLLLFLVLFAFGAFAQAALKPVAQMVQLYHNSNTTFKKVTTFSQKEAFTANAEQFNVLDQGTMLTLNPTAIQTVVNEAPAAIEFSLPSTTWGDMTLDLVKVNLFTPGFQVLTDESDAPVDFTPGVYYRGIVKGDNNSLAAISIVNGEVMGFVSSDTRGNLVLAKMEGFNPQNKHILYADKDLKMPAPAFCEMEDDNEPAGLNDQPAAGDRNVGDCVSLWIEVDRDITNNKGGVTGATSWITGVFNQVFTLYTNESLEFGINTIFVWSGSGQNNYKGNSSSVILNNFQNGRSGSFTGNLAILCNLKSSAGGIAAGFAGLCNSNRRNSMCFAGLQSTYANVPTYSWTIMVCTHELGHLLSSRHTHACVWNGNNTAIDGCSAVEGSCPRPGNPAGGGTIMSYCHLQPVGINFNNGFGPQPGNKIRDGVANATCLAASCTNFAEPLDDRDKTGNLAAAKVTLTPNPATDRVRIDVSAQLNDGETGIIRVFDAQGRLATTLNVRDRESTLYLETASLQPGIYFVDLETSFEKFTTRLVVK